MASLNNKITCLCILNILFSFSFFTLGLLNLFEVGKNDSNSDTDLIIFFLIFLVVGTFHFCFPCSIMCSTTECGDPISPEDRLIMACCCLICLQCRDMAANARTACSKFAFIIVLIIIDIIGLILNIIYCSDNSLFIEGDICFGIIIFINIMFCIFRKKMNLFEDYYEDIRNDNLEGHILRNYENP